MKSLFNNIKKNGFTIDEIMTGSHKFETGCGRNGKHPFKFRAIWGPKNLHEWLNPKHKKFLTNDLEGFITIGGLCDQVPIKGKLELRYFKDRSIKYSFYFKIKNKDYEYIGEKINIHPLNLLTSHTTCFGTVIEKNSGKLISRSVTHFRFRDTLKFLLSLKVVKN